MKKGYIIVFTGDGKGKTTASLGLALRAMGHEFKVCLIQFIKGSWTPGELEALKRFDDLLDLHVMGKGFTWESKNMEEDIRMAREAWRFAKEVIASDKYQFVILDEFTYLLSYHMINESEVLRVLSEKPHPLHIVITGRRASRAIKEAADLVSEIKEVKHPMSLGVRARQGIEY
jgi:cob(I)alamin adenosyltransferase